MEGRNAAIMRRLEDYPIAWSMEHVCRNRDLPAELEGLGTGKDTEHRCQSLVEEHEEMIESWYFHKQTSNPDFVAWLCIDSLTMCCPNGTFGAKCDPCPGDSNQPCFGRGKCQGEGTRTGSGKCKCDTGYVGNLCRKCDTNYYVAEQNDTFVDCRKCDDSCKGGCKFGGAIGCHDCRPGWKLDSVKGCEDVNECEEDPCREEGHEKCVNSPGSFECVCIEGYKKEDSKCVIDVIEKPKENEPSTEENNETAAVPDPEPEPITDDKVEL
uniref:EGF-like domain-containing protein n=1 Tax=Plectus sambesii TaxID=2011161 RepID=A0A914WU08_9BILA